jgi:hypothetical protein
MLLKRLKKYKERLELTILIESFEKRILISLCSYYTNNVCSYIVVKENSSRCNKYIRRSRKYDI